MMTQTPDTRPMALAGFLLLMAFMVLAMAVIGAITRLTESGLSMVEWRPLIGTLPPLTDGEWRRVFDLYRQTPEYQIKNAGMGLEQFQTIFFWEWFHRLWGRLIGVVFAVGALALWLSGRLPAAYRGRMLGFFALGGAQAVLGYYMVQSGLIDRPSVSQYRLAAHLGLALIIFTLLWVQAVAILRAGAPITAQPAGFGRLAMAALALLAVTILWGAFVAGLDAGFAYNTWPLMAGDLLPPEAHGLSPWALNLTENVAMVQFLHRWLAAGTVILLLVLAWRAQASAGAVTRRLGAGVAAMGLTQAGLGIATLLAGVPVWLGAAHQAGAVILLALVSWLVLESRRRAYAPSPAAVAASGSQSGPSINAA